MFYSVPYGLTSRLQPKSSKVWFSHLNEPGKEAFVSVSHVTTGSRPDSSVFSFFLDQIGFEMPNKISNSSPNLNLGFLVLALRTNTKTNPSNTKKSGTCVWIANVVRVLKKLGSSNIFENLWLLLAVAVPVLGIFVFLYIKWLKLTKSYLYGNHCWRIVKLMFYS